MQCYQKLYGTGHQLHNIDQASSFVGSLRVQEGLLHIQLSLHWEHQHVTSHYQVQTIADLFLTCVNYIQNISEYLIVFKEFKVKIKYYISFLKM